MAAGDLVINLKLNGTSFAVEINKANELLRRFGRTAAGAGTQSAGAERQIGTLLGKLRDISIIGYTAVGAIQTLRSALFDWQLSIIDTNARIEKMTVLLAGLSKEANVGEGFKAAAKDLKTMFDLAKSAPFSMEEMTKSFVKFKAVNLDDPLRTLKGLVDAVAAFGGSELELHRASVAIQQMGGKGVISMEELRQQLGEAVPSAINVMAREMGMSYFKFVDEVSRGNVEAQKGINALTKGFENDFGGAAKRMMSTWSGMVSMLKTKWIQFQLEIGGEDGFFKEAKASLGELTRMLDNPEMVDFGREFGEMLAKSISGLREFLEWVVKNRSELLALTKASAAFIVVWQGTKLFNSIIRGFSAIWATVKLGLPAFTYLANLNPYLRVLSIAVTAIGTLGAGLYSMAGFSEAAEKKTNRLNASMASASGNADEYADALAKASVELTAMERIGQKLSDIGANDAFAEWRLLFSDISQSGLAESIAGDVDAAIAKIGELGAYAGNYYERAAQGVLSTSKKLMDEYIQNFAEMPNNARIVFVKIGIEFEVLIARMKSLVSTLSFDSLLTKLGTKMFVGDAAVAGIEDSRQAQLEADIQTIRNGGAEQVAAIDAENNARKKEQAEADASARAAQNLAREKEALARVTTELTEKVKTETGVVMLQSQAYKAAARESVQLQEKLSDALNAATPGGKEYTELVIQRNNILELAQSYGVMAQETAGAGAKIVQVQEKIVETQKALAASMEGVAIGSKEADQIIANYANAMTALTGELNQASAAHNEYVQTMRNVDSLSLSAAALLAEKEKAFTDAMGKQITGVKNGMLANVSTLKELHAILEEQYNLPKGLLDETKWAETRDRMGADIRGPVIKKGMHKGDQAMGEYQFMPKTLKEFDESLFETLEGRAELAAQYHARSMKQLGTDDKDLLLAAYNAGVGNVKKAGLRVPNIAETQGYVEEAQRYRRSQLQNDIKIGGQAGYDAMGELAAMDKRLEEVRQREEKHTRDLIALHGERGNEIARITIAANNQIAELRDNPLLSAQEIADREVAIAANAQAQILEIERQAGMIRNEYDRQTEEIRLSMLTDDKDVRLRLERQLQIDIQRVQEEGAATTEQLQARIAAMTARTNKEIVDAERKRWVDLADQIGNSIGSAFTSLAVGGESAQDTLRRLIESLRDMVIQLLIIKPLAEAISSALQGFMPSGKGTPAPVQNGPTKTYATGGVINSGLQPGIYRSPTYFPLANAGLHKFANGTGLLAEAGRAEAILPLERIGADLGVKASVAPVNVVINNNAPGVGVSAQQSTDGSMIEVIIEQIKSSMANDISTGRGGLSTTMERTYGLNRTAGAF